MILARFLFPLLICTSPANATCLRSLLIQSQAQPIAGWTPLIEFPSERIRVALSLYRRHPEIFLRASKDDASFLRSLAFLAQSRDRLADTFSDLAFTPPRYSVALYSPKKTPAFGKLLDEFLDLRKQTFSKLKPLVGKGFREEIARLRSQSVRDGVFDAGLFKRGLRRYLELFPLLFQEDASAGGYGFDRMTLLQLYELYDTPRMDRLAKLVERVGHEVGLSSIFEAAFKNVRETLDSELSRLNELRAIQIETAPALLSLARGRLAVDCNMRGGALHGCLKNTQTYLVRKSISKDAPVVGYGFIAITLHKKLRTAVPYLVTLNGEKLSVHDAQVARKLMLEDFAEAVSLDGSKAAIPNFDLDENTYFVNSPRVRKGLRMFQPEKARVLFPSEWEAVAEIYGEQDPLDLQLQFDVNRLSKAEIGIPHADVHILESQKSFATASPYQPVRDLSEIPIFERALIAAYEKARGHYTDQLFTEFGLTPEQGAIAVSTWKTLSSEVPLSSAQAQTIEQAFEISREDLRRMGAVHGN